MKSFKNATNAGAVVTVVEVGLRDNVTAAEVEAETVAGAGRMERTRPIATVGASVVNFRTINVTTSREEDMCITINN